METYRLCFINSVILFLGVDHLVFGVPEGIPRFNPADDSICFILHLTMAVSLLFDSLGKDIGRPDIWLHSPASMRQLIGAKFSLIVLAIGCSLVIVRDDCRYLLFRRRWGGFPLWIDLFLLLSVGVVILLNAIYVMALVFFFWSMYQVFRSRIGWFSIIVIIVLVNMWIIGWGVVWFTEVFQTVNGDGAYVWPDSDDGYFNV